MSSEKENKKDSVNEPATPYGSNRLRIFESFQQVDDFELRQSVAQNPEERIRETVQLIMRVYGVTEETLLKRKRNNKVTIKSIA